jgi:8-oxo-dGTP pyrophosphatase MutT (NUDIX family)
MNPLGLLGQMGIQRPVQHRGGAGILPLYTNYAGGPAFFFVTEVAGHAAGQGAIPYGMVEHGNTHQITALRELREETAGALKMEIAQLNQCRWVQHHRHADQVIWVAPFQGLRPNGRGLEIRQIFNANRQRLLASRAPGSWLETHDPFWVHAADIAAAIRSQPNDVLRVRDTRANIRTIRSRDASFLREVFRQNLHLSPPLFTATETLVTVSRLPHLIGTTTHILR